MSYEILTGDARALIAGIEADVIITDPVWPNCPPGLLQGSDDPEGLLSDVLAKAHPRVKRVVVVMRTDSDPRFLLAVPARWKFIRQQTLPYAIPHPRGRILMGNDVAYGFGEVPRSRPGRHVLPGQSSPAQPVKRDGHPCPRVLDHMRWLVEWWSEPGEVVLDPFAGSGTTVLAAHSLDRRGVGIEIDAGYAETARLRCASAVPQLPFPARAKNDDAQFGMAI